MNSLYRTGVHFLLAMWLCLFLVVSMTASARESVIEVNRDFSCQNLSQVMSRIHRELRTGRSPEAVFKRLVPEGASMRTRMVYSNAISAQSSVPKDVAEKYYSDERAFMKTCEQQGMGKSMVSLINENCESYEKLISLIVESRDLGLMTKQEIIAEMRAGYSTVSQGVAFRIAEKINAAFVSSVYEHPEKSEAAHIKAFRESCRMTLR